MRLSRELLSTIALLLMVAHGLARADDACAGFAWDVAHERSVFATAPSAQQAGHDVDSAPLVTTDRLYDLALSPQEQVTLAASPGKKALTDGAYAGLVRIKVASAGTYRVSLSRPFWVDVVKGGALIASTNFTGRPGCDAPHKLVQYPLPAGELLLQVSGATDDRVKIAVTAARATTAH